MRVKMGESVSGVVAGGHMADFHGLEVTIGLEQVDCESVVVSFSLKIP